MGFARAIPYHVLIADDSADDRFVLRRILERFPRFQVIGEVGDGEETIAYLSGQGAFRDRLRYPLPDLLLLDLKMPRQTGFDVLKWLGTNSFANLTVVVLSGSVLGQDVAASLALGAHGYWTKSAQTAQQIMIAQEIEALLDKRREQGGGR